MILFNKNSICWLTGMILFGILIYFRLYLSIKNAEVRENDVVMYEKLIDYHSTFNRITPKVERTVAGESEEIIIAVVVCKQRTKEALVMIKSALVFRGLSKVHFIIFSEYNLKKGLYIKLNNLNVQVNNSFTYQLYNLSFPKDKEKEWRELFRPCASQRLFLPNILTDVDKLLYVDTDVLFVNKLSDVWQHFYKMNSSQLAALTPEHEEPNVGWYNRFAKHPYYGELGVNSGVMLMDLKKMREFGWTNYLPGIYNKYKLNIPWGDQDIINIIFFYYPDKLYIYPCRYNYRGDHCMYKSVCKDAEVHGVSVVHGSRSLFHTDKQPTFRVIYEAFDNYQIGLDPLAHLVIPLIRSLKKTVNTRCGTVKNIFVKNMLQLFSFTEVNGSSYI